MLRAWLHKIIADSHSTAVSAFWCLVFGGGSFSLYLFQKQALEILTKNTPIWLSILLSLCSLLIALVVIKKSQNKKKNQRKWGTLIKAGGLKWLVSHSSGLVVHIKETPYCPNHEQCLIAEDNSFLCPKENCNFKTSEKEIKQAWPAIESEIEKIIRGL